ncbi:hypothetical protein SS50377_27006 [Spironucleus salmonicida]|uniref:Uncharacterized protein n=1 Tax=Spironucleus salmonicida TaxID=348837 RepID=V6LTD6_9EUKA|nr:hypothetical protein SS50377_27006 [Spironucleus salmonicida]|eukprot:EST47518.1 Hypothetical protein SS50377_12503 [Spironucleus salmonicida]
MKKSNFPNTLTSQQHKFSSILPPIRQNNITYEQCKLIYQSNQIQISNSPNSATAEKSTISAKPPIIRKQKTDIVYASQDRRILKAIKNNFKY